MCDLIHSPHLSSSARRRDRIRKTAVRWSQANSLCLKKLLEPLHDSSPYLPNSCQFSSDDLSYEAVDANTIVGVETSYSPESYELASLHASIAEAQHAAFLRARREALYVANVGLSPGRSYVPAVDRIYGFQQGDELEGQADVEEHSMAAGAVTPRSAAVQVDPSVSVTAADLDRSSQNGFNAEECSVYFTDLVETLEDSSVQHQLAQVLCEGRSAVLDSHSNISEEEWPYYDERATVEENRDEEEEEDETLGAIYRFLLEQHPSAPLELIDLAAESMHVYDDYDTARQMLEPYAR